MGKRGRRRAAGDGGNRPEKLTAPSSDYPDAAGNVLTLRGALSPATRHEYAQVLTGAAGRPSDNQEDAWQRAVEFLFERLAVRWMIEGAPIDRQRDLLLRLRASGADERAWIRTILREHCAEHFPDVHAP